MMTPDEIKAMLDLPESARAKLAAIEGPGFYVSSEGGWTDLHVCPSLRARWCPRDTMAIVQLAATFTSSAWWHVLGGVGECTAECVGGHATGATPRLAALRLLAAVTT